jgi:hypothetical protein
MPGRRTGRSTSSSSSARSSGGGRSSSSGVSYTSKGFVDGRCSAARAVKAATGVSVGGGQYTSMPVTRSGNLSQSSAMARHVQAHSTARISAPVSVCTPEAAAASVITSRNMPRNNKGFSKHGSAAKQTESAHIADWSTDRALQKRLRGRPIENERVLEEKARSGLNHPTNCRIKTKKGNAEDTALERKTKRAITSRDDCLKCPSAVRKAQRAHAKYGKMSERALMNDRLTSSEQQQLAKHLDRTAEQLAQLTFANGKPGPNPHIMKVDPSSL